MVLDKHYGDRDREGKPAALKIVIPAPTLNSDGVSRSYSRKRQRAHSSPPPPSKPTTSSDNGPIVDLSAEASFTTGPSQTSSRPPTQIQKVDSIAPSHSLTTSTSSFPPYGTRPASRRQTLHVASGGLRHLPMHILEGRASHIDQGTLSMLRNPPSRAYVQQRNDGWLHPGIYRPKMAGPANANPSANSHIAHNPVSSQRQPALQHFAQHSGREQTQRCWGLKHVVPQPKGTPRVPAAAPLSRQMSGPTPWQFRHRDPSNTTTPRAATASNRHPIVPQAPGEETSLCEREPSLRHLQRKPAVMDIHRRATSVSRLPRQRNPVQPNGDFMTRVISTGLSLRPQPGTPSQATVPRTIYTSGRPSQQNERLGPSQTEGAACSCCPCQLSSPRGFLLPHNQDTDEDRHVDKRDEDHFQPMKDLFAFSPLLSHYIDYTIRWYRYLSTRIFARHRVEIRFCQWVIGYKWDGTPRLCNAPYTVNDLAEHGQQYRHFPHTLTVLCHWGGAHPANGDEDQRFASEVTPEDFAQHIDYCHLDLLDHVRGPRNTIPPVEVQGVAFGAIPLHMGSTDPRVMRHKFITDVTFGCKGTAEWRKHVYQLALTAFDAGNEAKEGA